MAIPLQIELLGRFRGAAETKVRSATDLSQRGGHGRVAGDGPFAEITTVQPQPGPRTELLQLRQDPGKSVRKPISIGRDQVAARVVPEVDRVVVPVQATFALTVNDLGQIVQYKLLGFPKAAIWFRAEGLKDRQWFVVAADHSAHARLQVFAEGLTRVS